MATLGQWQFTPTLRMDQQWLSPQDGRGESNQLAYLAEPGHQLPLQRAVAQLAQLRQRFQRPFLRQGVWQHPHYFALPPFEIIANPNLKEETSHSFEWG